MLDSMNHAEQATGLYLHQRLVSGPPVRMDAVRQRTDHGQCPHTLISVLVWKNQYWASVTYCEVSVFPASEK